jgi:5-deoxy-glucuronate isomerase
MLADTRFRVSRRQGVQLLQRRAEHGARELTTHRLTLASGSSADFMVAGEETIVVLQEGTGTWISGAQSWPVARSSVFAEKATALFLPPGHQLRVEAATPLEAVLISTPASEGVAAVLCAPSDVTVATRGRDSYTREVHDIFVRDSHARRLMVGETFNPPGKWSSYPPHKHDGRDGEPVLEEIYYYRLDPPYGFGHQMIYTADGESVTHDVRDGDLVLLPYGYHPVSAAPGYSLYYLWAIAGDQRKLTVYDDPVHRWVNAVEPNAERSQ